MTRRSGTSRDGASFSRHVKDELSRAPFPRDPEGIRAEVAGFLVSSDRGNAVEDTAHITVSTGHPASARRLYNLWNSLFPSRAGLDASRSNRFDRRLSFRVSLPRDIAGQLVGEQYTRPVSEPRLARPYLRGVFLVGGSINDPRSGYHLELRCFSTDVTGGVSRILSETDVKASSSSGTVVYVKDVESIADFLRIVGASRSLLRFEDIRVLRAVRNRVNRRVNFETANVGKSVEAAMKQIDDVEALGSAALEGLSARTREVLHLRLEHPEASLRELGELANPPITKSTVEYHFRKIRHLAGRDSR